MGAAFNGGGWGLGAVLRDIYDALTGGSLLTGFNSYDGSLFGGLRAHQDRAVFERLHDYPGSSTAYDPESYGYEKDVGNVGSITHVADAGALRLAVNAGTVGGKSRLRSHDIVRYQPGCMPVVQITGYAGQAMSNLKVYRRSSVTGSPVDHPLATIAGYDATKARRYEIRYAYLGVEGADFYISGTRVHRFRSYDDPALDVPYMKTANLPISVEVVNVSANSQVVRFGLFDDGDGLFSQWEQTTPAAIDFTYKCSSARLVGGNGYAHRAFGYTRATTGIGVGLTPLFSIRCKSTINTVSSRAQIFPADVTFFAETNSGALELVWNPSSLTNATWAAASPSEGMEIDTAATGLSGGTTIWRTGQAQNMSQTYSLEKIFHALDRKIRRQAFTGVSDVLTFAVQREGAANFDPRVTLVTEELR